METSQSIRTTNLLTGFYIILTLVLNKLIGRGGGSNFTLACWFSLNNSETIKAVTLAFCSTQWNFMRNIRARFDIFNLQDIRKNSDGGISDFRISGQSLIKKNCHNSRISDDIDMKLGPVTKLDKRNKTTSKKFDNDVMSENCDVIVIFSIYGQFGATWKPDSGCIVCKTYIFINSNLFSYKNWKQN